MGALLTDIIFFPYHVFAARRLYDILIYLTNNSRLNALTAVNARAPRTCRSIRSSLTTIQDGHDPRSSP